ncbi:hypothetical protein AVEN_22148-1 [Araneus ventricosus]|uniref:Uncharacterized protein n=1 Tax=Araneus ventricosus TaxID=182803 RepID=A0A4Y2V4V6_ARAVE|nr:hypothetical protein AVEN_22148-1 [Araneus ventricosus]
MRRILSHPSSSPLPAFGVHFAPRPEGQLSRSALSGAIPLQAPTLNRNEVRSCRGKHFADDDDVQHEALLWMRQQPKEFYAAGIGPLIKRWDKCMNNGGGHVEK